MTIHIIYHGPKCADGFAASWAAYRKFKDKAFYYDYGYNESSKIPPFIEDGDEVYILDFSFDRAVLEEINKKASKLVVLDHHKSAEKKLKGLDYCTFDMAKSGARLAWEYFFPDDEVSWLVKYVEDRDLWNWNLLDSKEINAAISTYDFDTDLWDKWHSLPSRYKRELVTQGDAIVQYRDKLVKDICKHAYEVEIGKFTAFVVNCPILDSEVAGKLAEDADIGITWYKTEDGNCKFSFRGNGKDNPDLGELASYLGGGGHPNAAGLYSHMFSFDVIEELDDSAKYYSLDYLE